MSHQATTWVLERSEHEGIEFIVLFVIANHCGPDGTGAWPSMLTIGAESRSSERSARRAVKRLEESGELSVIRTKGCTPDKEWKSRNEYSIPGVIRDGFYRKRLPKPEANEAAGDTVPSGQPSGQPSGHEWPTNNPREQVLEQMGTGAQTAPPLICSACGADGVHKCPGRLSQKQREKRMARSRDRPATPFRRPEVAQGVRFESPSERRQRGIDQAGEEALRRLREDADRRRTLQLQPKAARADTG